MQERSCTSELRSRWSGRWARRASPLLTALIIAVVLLAAGCSSPRPPAPAGPAAATTSTAPGTVVLPPDTPAGIQLAWLIAAMAHLPVSDAEVNAHFDAGYLAMVSPAAVNQWLQALNEWLQAGTAAKLVSIRIDEPSMVVAIVSAGGAGPRARVGHRRQSGPDRRPGHQPRHRRAGARHVGRCRCDPPLDCPRHSSARGQRQ